MLDFLLQPCLAKMLKKSVYIFSSPPTEQARVHQSSIMASLSWITSCLFPTCCKFNWVSRLLPIFFCSVSWSEFNVTVSMPWVITYIQRETLLQILFRQLSFMYKRNKNQMYNTFVTILQGIEQSESTILFTTWPVESFLHLPIVWDFF